MGTQDEKVTGSLRVVGKEYVKVETEEERRKRYRQKRERDKQRRGF